MCNRPWKLEEGGSDVRRLGLPSRTLDVTKSKTTIALIIVMAQMATRGVAGGRPAVEAREDQIRCMRIVIVVGKTADNTKSKLTMAMALCPVVETSNRRPCSPFRQCPVNAIDGNNNALRLTVENAARVALLTATFVL